MVFSKRVYFKVVLTNKTIYYTVNFNWTLKEFLDNITPKIYSDFPEYSNNSIEIVDNIFNLNSREDKRNAIISFDEKTIKEIYMNHLKYLTFYIRPI